MKFGIQSRQNTLILNILFGIDDPVPNFSPTMEVLREHCLDSRQIEIELSLVIHKT